MRLTTQLKVWRLRRTVLRGQYDQKTVDAAKDLARLGDHLGLEFFCRALRDLRTGESAANELKGLGWTPSTQDERMDFLVAAKDWEAIRALGAPALNALLEAVTTRRYPAERIVTGLLEFRPVPEQELVAIMKNGRLDWDTRTGDYSKSEWIAESLNMGRSIEDDYIVCISCHKYLGLRKELLKRSRSISERERTAAASRRMVILARHVFRCPNCSIEMFM